MRFFLNQIPGSFKNFWFSRSHKSSYAISSGILIFIFQSYYFCFQTFWLLFFTPESQFISRYFKPIDSKKNSLKLLRNLKMASVPMTTSVCAAGTDLSKVPKRDERRRVGREFEEADRCRRSMSSRNLHRESRRIVLRVRPGPFFGFTWFNHFFLKIRFSIYRKAVLHQFPK